MSDIGRSNSNSIGKFLDYEGEERWQVGDGMFSSVSVRDSNAIHSWNVKKKRQGSTTYSRDDNEKEQV